MSEDKESKGSKSSSTQETIANFRKLKEDICGSIDKLIFGFPQYRGLKPVVWILGIVFEDGRIHTIRPHDLKYAKQMLERMSEEIDKKINEAEEN
jgi:hypothetical protein